MLILPIIIGRSIKKKIEMNLIEGGLKIPNLTCRQSRNIWAIIIRWLGQWPVIIMTNYLLVVLFDDGKCVSHFWGPTCRTYVNVFPKDKPRTSNFPCVKKVIAQQWSRILKEIRAYFEKFDHHKNLIFKSAKWCFISRIFWNL